MESEGYDLFQPSHEAEDEWSAHTREIHEQTLMAQGDKVNSWMMGANLEQKSRGYWSTLEARIFATTNCASQPDGGFPELSFSKSAA